MKISVNQKRRRLLKLGGVAAILPVTGTGNHAAIRSAQAGEPGTSPTTDSLSASAQAASPLTSADQALLFQYDQPAVESNIQFQGLPVGNGRLGALAGGASEREALYLNEITLWSGSKDVVDLSYTTTGMGTYLSLGKLYIDLPGHAGATSYQRSLDISNALVRTQYSVGGRTYRREIFSSFPDNVIVVRLTSDGGTYNGTVSLIDGQGTQTIGESNHAMSFSGSVSGSGELYASYLSVIPDAGTARFDSANAQITLQNCPALTIIFAARTDYTGRYVDSYLTGINPRSATIADVTNASARGYWDLLWRHVRDYRGLFGRMELNLGTSSAAQKAMPIPARLQARGANAAVADPELEAMYVQFGRYLTISSSRGSMPANLQGLWSTTNNPPWMADYHTDINVQMNYWLADRAGLPECQLPFADYVTGQFPSWVQSTRNHFNDAANVNYSNSNGKVAGWTVAISTGIYGSIGWDWSPPASAWYCRTLWNHYQYTLDKRYLANIYPVMKSACEFWQARLIRDPVTGLLIDDKDWSPEQGPHQQLGITYAQELVWDLFTNTVAASQLLGKDADFAQTLATMKAQLYLPKVSPTTGQLQEWMSDSVVGETGHRHLSPLIGWFEGERITLDSDPKLVAGVKALLTARGFNSFGWGLAWRIACWAHFHDAATCYSMIPKLLNYSAGNDGVNGTFANMFDAYALSSNSSAFQIDANFGGPAAILEMLLQSRMDRITLLPALPAQWGTGSVKGLRAKGGFAVDLAWSRGALSSVKLTSVGGTRTNLFYGNASRAVAIPENGTARFDGNLRPVSW
ncbi:glycoside hydrolase N-terminal domain-containing protein [Paraburkholderia sediminicola]|uniref:glycosyl hydrolase family 95 catalytic domain-containing protein n=1 Tax=Paraburkholderia sediminicola TaxID=458836 RepID=UPI0038B87B72